MPTKCFLIEPAMFMNVYLRRYAGGSTCPINHYHDATRFRGEIAETIDDRGCFREGPNRWAGTPHDNEFWPKVCACGYAFQDSDAWQVFTESVWRRVDNGDEYVLRDGADGATPSAPPGAMWFAPWIDSYAKGEDGRCLVVKLPNGHDWIIDSRASNCGLPLDDVHHCWIRHGEPPNVTVDKNGVTCNAGAGSIQSGDYHGFLRNGYLT